MQKTEWMNLSTPDRMKLPETRDRQTLPWRKEPACTAVAGFGCAMISPLG